MARFKVVIKIGSENSCSRIYTISDREINRQPKERREEYIDYKLSSMVLEDIEYYQERID